MRRMDGERVAGREVIARRACCWKGGSLTVGLVCARARVRAARGWYARAGGIGGVRACVRARAHVCVQLGVGGEGRRRRVCVYLCVCDDYYCCIPTLIDDLVVYLMVYPWCI